MEEADARLEQLVDRQGVPLISRRRPKRMENSLPMTVATVARMPRTVSTVEPMSVPQAKISMLTLSSPRPVSQMRWRIPPSMW